VNKACEAVKKACEAMKNAFEKSCVFPIKLTCKAVVCRWL